MAKRVAELEKSLGEAQEREQTRGELEKTQVDRLLALADVIGSKYSAPCLLCFCRLRKPYGCGFLLVQRLTEVLLRKELPVTMLA